MLNIGASVELDAVARKILGGTLLDDVKRGVGEVMQDRIASYYAGLPQDYFDNPAPFPDGTSRRGCSRRWMYALSQSGRGDAGGWQSEWVGDTLEVFFVNPERDRVAYGLRLHQYGGTITPKNVAALTIPLTSAARGVRAADFLHELFLVKGDAAKEDPELIGTLCWKDEAGALHAAYALRKSSTIPPLRERRGHDALPGEGMLARFLHDAFTDILEAELTGY